MRRRPCWSGRSGAAGRIWPVDTRGAYGGTPRLWRRRVLLEDSRQSGSGILKPGADSGPRLRQDVLCVPRGGTTECGRGRRRRLDRNGFGGRRCICWSCGFGRRCIVGCRQLRTLGERRWRTELGERRHRLAGSGLSRLLQRLDRLLERQSLRFEESRRHTAALPHDRRKDDGAVDSWPPALTCGQSCVFQDLGEPGRDTRVRRAAVGRPLDLGTDEACDIVSQPAEIDAADLQHDGRILVLGEGEEKVLEHDLEVALLAGIVAGAHQGGLKRRRHCDFAELVHHRLNHPATAPRSGSQASDRSAVERIGSARYATTGGVSNPSSTYHRIRGRTVAEWRCSQRIPHPGPTETNRTYATGNGKGPGDPPGPYQRPLWGAYFMGS